MQSKAIPISQRIPRTSVLILHASESLLLFARVGEKDCSKNERDWGCGRTEKKIIYRYDQRRGTEIVRPVERMRVRKQNRKGEDEPVMPACSRSKQEKTRKQKDSQMLLKKFGTNFHIFSSIFLLSWQKMLHGIHQHLIQEKSHNRKLASMCWFSECKLRGIV